MKFRYDINGLRAISVLGVLFFHAGIESFSGGFLGVDTFFVISGFLITSHIIRDFDSESFSLVNFYMRRARRIMPALIVTMIVTTLASLYFMLPYDLKNFGQSLVSTSLGANNILLYLTSGYWSLAAEFKPLYHTWSLGVEEQYYFIVPLLFICFFSRGIYQYVFILLFSVSWLVSLFSNNLEFDFLSITNRFWELCAGSLLAMYYPKIRYKNDCISFLGLALIIFSFLEPYCFSSVQAIYSIVPLVGAILVIAFSKSNGLVESLFRNKVFLILGFSSYSIYLLHQPLLSFFRLYHEAETSVFSEFLVVLVSIPCGIAMWKYIENVFRNENYLSNRAFVSVVLLSLVSLLSFGLILHKTYGLQAIDSFAKYSYGNNPQRYADRPYQYAKEEFETSFKKMLIIGDSFGRDFANAVSESGLTEGYEVIYLHDYFADTKISRKLSSSADVVFWVSSEGKAHHLGEEGDLIKRSTAEKLELDKYASDYLYIGTKNYGFNNNFVKHLDWVSSVNYMVDISHSSLRANEIQSEIFGDKYVDLISLTRNNDLTRIFTDEHKFISFDTDHITRSGAVYIGNLLLNDPRISNYKLMKGGL